MLLRLCGMALVRSDAVAAGLPYLARSRRMAPREPVAALWHGIALHAAGRFAEAAATLAAAAALAPADPAPSVHLARALLQSGRPQEALAAARRAESLAPALLEARHARRLAELAVLSAPGNAAPDPQDLADAWLELGLVCARLGRVADARAAMRRALAARPSHTAAAANLAMIEHLCGEPVTAMARLRDTLAHDPGCGVARLHLASRLILDADAGGALALLDGAPPEGGPGAQWRAQRTLALVQLGRYREARTELEAVPRPAADAEILLCRAQFLLARQTGDRGATVASARALARLASDHHAAGLEHRINAQFTLADWCHAESMREAAFAHWTHGHALLRTAQPFDRAEHQSFVDALIEAFSRDRLAAGPRAAIPASEGAAPVFIVGLPRTGTSLTEHILAAHPMVHGAGERLALREILLELTGTGDPIPAARRAAALDRPALTAAAAAYMAELRALAPGARLVLDKMPDNFSWLGFIATLLPGARVICCTRDLRDVGASIFQHRFFGHHPYAHDLSDLGWAMAQHRRLLRHWRALPELPMLLVDHADWLDDFDATLRRVLDFLGLAYDPACAHFHEQDRVVHTASREQVKQPLNARGVGRWRPYAAWLAPMLRELPG